MTDQPPLVSILVRSTNRTTLARALDSVAAQTWPHLEIVVVAASGQSHPPLDAVWRGRPVRFLPTVAPLSRPVAANTLLANARGKYLNFLDDDDELMPHHVDTLVNALEATPAMRLAYTIARVFDEQGRDVGRLGKPGHHLLMFHQNRFAIHAALFSRQLVEQGIRFDPSFDRLEDLDFFVACGARTEFLFVPSVSCTWHAFGGSSGMGYAANSNQSVQATTMARIRHKWRKHFERWSKEPEGLLALAESVLKDAGGAPAAPVFAKIRDTEWATPELTARANAIKEAIDHGRA